MSIAVTPTPERTTRHLHSESQTLGRLRSQTTASPAERNDQGGLAGLEHARGRCSIGSSARTRPGRTIKPPSVTSARTVSASWRRFSARGPDLHYRPVKGALVVLPSAPRIAPSQKLRLVMGE